MNKKCPQCIIGFSQGYADPSDPDYEEPELIYEDCGFPDKWFEYCPACGNKIWQPEGWLK